MSLLAVSCQKGVPRFFPYQLLPQQWKLLHNRSIIGVTWQLYHQKNSSVVKKVNKSLPKTEKRARLFRPKTTLIILGIVFWRPAAPPAEFERYQRVAFIYGKMRRHLPFVLKSMILGEVERMSLFYPKEFSYDALF